MLTLYHFSEDPSIEVFHPRTMPHRPEITIPLVWAIEAERDYMYLFPRDCPRILLWPTPETTEADRDAFFRHSDARAVAYIEYDWLDRLRSTTTYRYAMPPATFEDLDDAGMWVSRDSVTPSSVEAVANLPETLQRTGVELRVMGRLTPLYGLWETTTLHWSAIRMANAQGWEANPSTVPARLRP